MSFHQDDAARLCQLRELRKTLAQREVLRERQAATQCDQVVAQAQAVAQQCAQQLGAHWQAVRGGLGVAVELSPAQLRDTVAWSGVLQARTVQAQGGVQQAHEQAVAQHERLGTQRQAWRAAQNGLDKARQLQRRLQAQLSTTRERRLEDEWDEAALQARARLAGSKP